MSLIRPLAADDVEAIHTLGINEPSFCFEQPGFWSPEQLSRWFQSPDDVCLGAFEQGKAIGFSLASVHQATRKATWENLYVVREARGTGIAEELTAETMKELEIRGATYVHFLVDAERMNLHRFFNKLGFASSGSFMWMGRNIVKE